MRASGDRGGATRGLVWRTAVALVLTAVLPVLLVGGLAATSLQQALTERATSDLALLAEAQAGRLELVGAGAATSARLIASRTQLRRDLAALLDGDATRLERLGDILGDTVDATPDVRAVSLVDVDGVVLAGQRDQAVAHAALGAADLDLNDPDAVASVVIEGERLDRWLVVTPLHLEGRVLGAALVELDLSAIAGVLTSDLDRPVAARTCVFHRRADGSPTPLRVGAPGAAGECDTAALPDVAATGSPGDELAELARASVDGPVDGVDAAGVQVLATGREVLPTGWLVVVSLPRSDLLAPVRPSTVAVGAAALVIAAVAGACAVVLAHRLTGPIRVLGSTVRAIEDGDLAARARVEGPGELGELARGVNGMAEALEQETQAREQRYRDLEALTHAMAHDLRGPLTTVQGMLELVATDRVADPQQQAELLERARGAAARMQHLIADLLTLVRTHGAELERRPVDLEQAFDAAAELLGVSEVIQRDPLPTVPGDRILLAQVAQNLLSNAVRYHPPEVDPQVRVSSRRREGAVELRVDDAGVGIPASERHEVLELFYRGERTRQTQGTGLGLPIAVRAIERHGGEVRIEDSPLGGTRMVVCLPTDDPDGEATAGGAQPCSLWSATV